MDLAKSATSATNKGMCAIKHIQDLLPSIIISILSLNDCHSVYSFGMLNYYDVKIHIVAGHYIMPNIQNHTLT